MAKDTDYNDKPDEPTKRLDQDFDTPFSDPSDVKKRMPPDYPSKDSLPDMQEKYDEGEDDASTDDNPYGKKGASGEGPHKVF